ncbi:MAG: recombination regulator RecX [Oscillospiraceae bacterium]|nr:recombination regulator RecX [Oscillospiraceae bacterium]
MQLSTDYEKAKNHALKILAMRDYSSAGLSAKLCKYYDEKTARKVITRLKNIGCINDEIYSEKLAAHLLKTKHYGKRKARYEMKLKGVSDDLINAAIDAFDDDEIIEIIAEFVAKKYRDYLADWQGMKKTTDALARRGYDYDDIKIAISQVKKEMENDE